MKILVTGSEGSLMQAVIPFLLRAGHEVRGADNFCRYGKLQRQRDYEFVEGDLVDPGFAREVTAGVDGVIQAAARIYGVHGFHKFPADILAHDVTLHQNILWAAKDEGVKKLCYISSSMVFERCSKHPSDEEDAMNSLIPSTDYGLSKLVGERLCMAFARQYGLKYVIWRPFNIITPLEEGESEQGLSHVFADFVRLIIQEKQNPLPILGDGEQVRCFTWIEDIAETIATRSFDDVTDNQTYNVGNPEPITMAQLAVMIFEEAKKQGALPDAAGELQFTHKTVYADDVRVRIPDVSKAEQQLGWQPTVKAAEAVRRCVAHTLQSS